MTKSQLLKCFTSLEEGKHIDIPGVEVIEVDAFRLVPGNEEEGCMTTDGECIPVGPVQAQIIPSIANVYVK